MHEVIESSIASIESEIAELNSVDVSKLSNREQITHTARLTTLHVVLEPKKKRANLEEAEAVDFIEDGATPTPEADFVDE